MVFEPTAVNYRDVLFGATTILPNLVSSVIVSGLTTVLTMLFAIPAAYALSRLDLPFKRASGFYVLATQMLPPVGLVIPYFLILRKVGWTDTYQGLVLVYLTFALPFAIWLLVSYFEEIPRDGRRTLVYCAGGSRSAAACEFLSREGYDELYNLEGGFQAWSGPRAKP